MRGPEFSDIILIVQPAEVIIDDVWSRTAPKYRMRAVGLLLANMALFGVLCCFMFWLRTGWYFPPSYPSYDEELRTAFRFSGGQQVTVHDLLARPISLQQVPIHGVVIGLLFAALAGIPILVSILYRLPAALPFCAMVAFLAVMPWLGANLVLASAMAHYLRKRVKFRFAAGLLALIPFGVYLLVSSRKYRVEADLLASPIEQGLVIVPLLLSVVAACALIGASLAVAKVVNYRPGAITPLMAVMFLTPWFLFMTQVGRDELHYRFLALDYGPGSKKFFVPMDARSSIRDMAAAAWLQDPGHVDVERLTARITQAWDEHLEPLQPEEVELLTQDWLHKCRAFAREQFEVISRCQKFIEDFGASRYVPCALYIMGRAQDMRVDRVLFRREGQFRFYDDFPSEVSRPTWRELESKFPKSRLAQIARFKMAQLDARAGKVNQALVWLSTIEANETPASGQPDPDAAKAPEPLMAKEGPDESFYEECKETRAKARALRRLLEDNRDPLTGDAPLVAFLNCDPRHAAYQQNLAAIVEHFEQRPDMRIRDNIELELAMQLTTPAERARRLERILSECPDGDTRPRVLYELALACEEHGDLTTAGVRFKELEDEYPDSPYADIARRWRLSP